MGLVCGVLMACGGTVQPPETTVNSSVQAMAETNSLTLVSNSTQSQKQCASANSITLQIALSSQKRFYCRDRSRLMDSARLGLTCQGGVTIVNPSVDSKVVDCADVTVCGVMATSTTNVAQRVDGSFVKQMKFENLPWGCQGLVEASSDPGFSATQSKTVQFQILPPTCRYCATLSGLTCGNCPTATVDSDVVAGQVIPKTCPGGCATCAYLGGVQVNHGDTRAFYSSSNVGCGQRCGSVQTTRVCNNGSWVPSSQDSFSMTCMEPAAAACIRPASVASVSVRSIASTMWGLFQTSSTVSTRSVQRVQADGTATCADCQAGACTACKTAAGESGYRLYSQITPPAGGTCESVSECMTCDNRGLFQGDPSFKYPSCTIPRCTASALSSPASDGETKTFYASGSGSCSPMSLLCSNGSWFRGASLVSQTTVNSYVTSCNSSNDCTTQGGVTVLNGQTIYVFKTNLVAAGASCYSNGNYASVNCVSGVIAPADPGVDYKFTSCAGASCTDPTYAAGTRTIPGGTTRTFYKIASTDCSSANPQAVCDANSIAVTCPNTGGTATISPAGVTPTQYSYSSCTVPTSCSACSVTTNDSGRVSVNVGFPLTLYSAPSAQFCAPISATFNCNAGAGGTSPALVGSAGESISSYPYLRCTSSGVDEGSLGGTGGGTGNDSGPGSALKKRFGSGDGSGGSGAGCLDATKCLKRDAFALMPRPYLLAPCLLPWGTAELEYYGSIIAFGGAPLLSGTTDTICVTKPQTCSQFRQVRTCHYPGLTGSTTYRFPSCVERDVCP